MTTPNNLFAAFERDIIVTKDDGLYTIECPKGLWAVSGPDMEELEGEALHYYRQYRADGEYEEQNRQETEAASGVECSDMLEVIENIINCCDHQIPHYAYGDNEAACHMSHLLRQIGDDLTPIAEYLTANDKMNRESDWIWMMDWCKKNGLPPAQKYGWDAAKKARIEFLSDND